MLILDDTVWREMDGIQHAKSKDGACDDVASSVFKSDVEAECIGARISADAHDARTLPTATVGQVAVDQRAHTPAGAVLESVREAHSERQQVE